MKIDHTAPSIRMSATTADGLPYSSGIWVKHAVIVRVHCSDEGSGVASVSDAVTITAEGAGQSATGSCTDLAGNTATTTFTGINVDRSGPSIQCGAADGVWHAGNVSIPCTASKGMSGLAHAGDATFSLVTNVAAGVETAGAQTDARTVCDVAANCASADPIGGNRIDRKAPVIAIASPQANAAYILNQLVSAKYTCNDGGAGTITCAGGVAPAWRIDTSSPRAGIFTVNAADRVGNRTSLSVTYTSPTASTPCITKIGRTGTEARSDSGWN